MLKQNKVFIKEKKEQEHFEVRDRDEVAFELAKRDRSPETYQPQNATPFSK